MYLGRFNKLLTYPFNPARAWKLDSKITHQIVARSNMGVDVYSISSRCFLLLTGREWFWSFLFNCVYKHCVSVHIQHVCMCVLTYYTGVYSVHGCDSKKSGSQLVSKKNQFFQLRSINPVLNIFLTWMYLFKNVFVHILMVMMWSALFWFKKVKLRKKQVKISYLTLRPP